MVPPPIVQRPKVGPHVVNRALPARTRAPVAPLPTRSTNHVTVRKPGGCSSCAERRRRMLESRGGRR